MKSEWRKKANRIKAFSLISIHNWHWIATSQYFICLYNVTHTRTHPCIKNIYMCLHTFENTFFLALCFARSQFHCVILYSNVDENSYEDKFDFHYQKIEIFWFYRKYDILVCYCSMSWVMNKIKCEIHMNTISYSLLFGYRPTMKVKINKWHLAMILYVLFVILQQRRFRKRPGSEFIWRNSAFLFSRIKSELEPD